MTGGTAGTAPASGPTSTRPLVVLIGPPGAGKTTIGQLVAQRLAVPFTDTDELVVRRAGRSVSDIFVLDGEAAFRELERDAVAEALRGPGVVALGGGAVMDPRTEADLVDHRVVFLDVRIADAAGRVGFDQSRPLLAVNPRAQWTALMNERRPVYARVGARVDTAGREPETIADDVVRLLERPQDAGAGSTAATDSTQE
ncbi:MAG TPA: shikimate kinase [Actinomycetales bacterium]|nr:shikimate kinase [Actinomycetales bacterium]